MSFDLYVKVILVFINAIGLLLIWWVTRSGSGRNIKKWFFTMTFCVLLWANFSYFASHSISHQKSLILYRLNWASVSLFLFSFYNFYVINFLKKKGVAVKLGMLIMIMSFLFMLISFFTNLIVKDVVSQIWGMEIVFGPFGFLFNIFSAVVAILVTFYSLQGYSKLASERKRKLKYFLSGILIFVFANLVFNVGSQIFTHSVKYQFLGDFSSVFLLGFTAYSTIQYKLFDVKVVATEALTALLLTVLLSKLFVSQRVEEFIVDFSIFVLALLFGIMLVRSVDREIRQKEKLQELTQKLKAIDKQKDEFLSMAAHELRAPLTAIKGYVSMVVSEDFGKLPDKAKSYLNDASSVNDRLIRLVNNMLNVSRIEEGRMVYSVGDVKLSDVVKEVYTSFRFEAERKNLTFSIEPAENLLDKVRVDQDRIHEVVGNFVSNAVKYTEKGGIRVKLTNPSVGKVRVEVIDTGPGISAAEQKKLFRKFYRVESEVGKTIGTGLGLYISKLLVEKFKGKMGLVSEEGKGSNFWFELPLVTDDAPPIQNESEIQSPPSTKQ